MKEGWKYSTIGECCDILNGFAFKSTEYVCDGIRVIRITNVQNGYIDDKEPKYYPYSKELEKYMLFEDDLLLSLTGNVGRVGILSSSMLPAALNQRVACLRIKNSKIILRYLFNYLNSKIFEDDCIKSSKGAAQMNMSTVWLSKYVIPLPTLQVQQRIVDYLDSAFAKIDALKAKTKENLDNAQALFQATLKEMMTPKEGWEERKLGDIGDLKNGINFARNESGYDIHILGVGDFEDKFCIEETDSLPIISLNGMPNEEFLLKDEDIVFVRSNGNKMLVGRSILVYTGNTPTSFSGFCIRFRKRFSQLDTRYLLYYLKLPNTRRRLFGNGANISNLNQQVLKRLSIAYPPLSSEQTAIVSRIDSYSEKIKNLEANYIKISAECDALKQSLLRQIFE